MPPAMLFYWVIAGHDIDYIRTTCVWSSRSITFKHVYPVLKRTHDDVIKWKNFPPYCPLSVEFTGSPHKGQWRGDFMFSLICAWSNNWANNRDAGDLRRHRAHCDVTVIYELQNMSFLIRPCWQTSSCFTLAMISIQFLRSIFVRSK